MLKRTPNIFLSPRQFEARARAEMDQAKLVRPGKARNRLLEKAEHDQTMANMKRLIGDGENEATK